MTKQQSTYARLYKTFYTTILLERIGGGITILKRGVIITFGCVYYVSITCIMSAVEVEASWSWTSQLTQHKYIVKAYTIVELIMYHSCII